MFSRWHIIPLGVGGVLEPLVLHFSFPGMGKPSSSPLEWVRKVQPVRDGPVLTICVPAIGSLFSAMWVTPADLLGGKLEVLKQPGSKVALSWGARNSFSTNSPLK